MNWMIIIGIVALAIVAFELLMRGPSVFELNDPRTLSEALRVLVARGKHLASLRIETKSPTARLRVLKRVERGTRIWFTVTIEDARSSIATDAGHIPVRRVCDVEHPCLESGVERVVHCLRLALDEAHEGGGGTLPIRGRGSLSGILAFNVSQATGVTKAAPRAQ